MDKKLARDDKSHYAMNMDTHSELIDAFGGIAEYASVVGMSYETAKKQRQRNRIPSDYWTTIVARAPRVGLDGITLDFIASLRVGRQAKTAGCFQGRHARRLDAAAA